MPAICLKIAAQNVLKLIKLCGEKKNITNFSISIT